MISTLLPAGSSFWFVDTQHMDEVCSLTKMRGHILADRALAIRRQVGQYYLRGPVKNAWEVRNLGPFPES